MSLDYDQSYAYLNGHVYLCACGYSSVIFYPTSGWTRNAAPRWNRLQEFHGEGAAVLQSGVWPHVQRSWILRCAAAEQRVFTAYDLLPCAFGWVTGYSYHPQRIGTSSLWACQRKCSTCWCPSVEYYFGVHSTRYVANACHLFFAPMSCVRVKLHVVNTHHADCSCSLFSLVVVCVWWYTAWFWTNYYHIIQYMAFLCSAGLVTATAYPVHTTRLPLCMPWVLRSPHPWAIATH